MRRYQWVLGIVWLVVAIAMVFRESLLSPAIIERIRPGNEWLIVLMALVFAGWNFARWYAYWQRRTKVIENPLVSKNSNHVTRAEFHPEFDFQNHDMGGNPNTSTP